MQLVSLACFALLCVKIVFLLTIVGCSASYRRQGGNQTPHWHFGAGCDFLGEDMLATERDDTSFRRVDSEETSRDTKERNDRCGGEGATVIQVSGWEGIRECGVDGPTLRIVHTIW